MERFSCRENSQQLLEACMDNDTIKVENCLVFGNINVNDQRDGRGRSPMHIAASRANVDILKILCRHGGNLELTDNIGNTLLHLCNHMNVLEFLKEQGLSPFERNHNGETPSMLAERFGASNEVIEFLYQMEEDYLQDKPSKGCPIFKRNTYSSSKDENYFSWSDEMMIGRYQLLAGLLVISGLSLYITYCIIGELPFGTRIMNEVSQGN